MALLQVYFHLWMCEPKCCFKTINPLLKMSCFNLCWISKIVAIFWNVGTLPWKELFSCGHLVSYRLKGTIQFMNLMEQYMFRRSVFPNFCILFLKFNSLPWVQGSHCQPCSISFIPYLEFQTSPSHVPWFKGVFLCYFLGWKI